MLDKITAQKPFKPLPQLRTKYMIYLALIYSMMTLFPALIMLIVGGFSGELNNLLIGILAFVVAFIILMAISIPPASWYYRSINYEILEDEVHVDRGVVTKTRKIVPYRTITNIDVKRGPFDRLLNIGTIEIQTAGNSAQKVGPEERLDGVPGDLVVKIQETLLNKVRRVRGSAATSHDVDEDDVMAAILHEVRELRKYLTK